MSSELSLIVPKCLKISQNVKKCPLQTHRCPNGLVFNVDRFKRGSIDYWESQSSSKLTNPLTSAAPTKVTPTAMTSVEPTAFSVIFLL